jgi:hypothetical protein
MCITSETCRANSVIKTALNNLHQAGPNKTRKCEDNLNTDVKELSEEVADCIHSTWERNHFWVLLNRITKHGA